MSSTARKRNRQGKTAASKRSKSGTTSTEEDANMVIEDVFDPTAALIDLQRLLPAMEDESKSMTLPPHELRSRADLCRRLHAAAQPDPEAFGPRVDAACDRAEQMAQEQEAKMAANGTMPSNPVHDIFYSKPSPAVSASVENAPASKAPASPTATSKTPVVSPPPPTNVKALQQNQREQMEVAVSQMATQMKEQTSALHATLQSQNTHLLDEVQDVTEENVRDVTDVASATQQHVQRGWRRTAATWGLLLTVALATMGTLVTIQMVPKSQRQHVVLEKLADIQWPCVWWWCEEGEPQTHQEPEETADDVPDLVDDSYGEDVPNLDDESTEEEFNREEETVDPEEPQEQAPPVEEVEPHHQEEEQSRVSEPVQEDPIPRAGASYRHMARAASEGHLDVVRQQLTRQPGFVHTQDDNGWALIHEAARAGFLELIELLVEFGANLSLETGMGETPMDLALMELDSQHPAILYMESILHQSNDQHEEPERDDQEQTEEEEEEEQEAETEEEAQAEPNTMEIDPAGNIQVPTMDADAMREAALREFEEMQAQASSTGAASQQAASMGASNNMDGADDPFSSEAKVITPGGIHVYDGKPFSGRELRRVASRGDSRRMSGFLEQNPAFIDQPDQNGWTALHLAVRAGHTEVVQLLLQAGADSTLVTQQGRTVMDMAILKFDSEPHPIIDMLEEFEH